MSFQSFLWAICSLSFSLYSTFFSLHIYSIFFLLYSLLYLFLILPHLKYLLFASSGSTLHLLHSVLFSIRNLARTDYTEWGQCIYSPGSLSAGHFRQTLLSITNHRSLKMTHSKQLSPSTCFFPFASSGLGSGNHSTCY